MHGRHLGAAVLSAVMIAACASDGREPLEGRPVSLTVNTVAGFPAAERFYAGGGSCKGCHERAFLLWGRTAHAGSYQRLEGSPDAANASCLRCHTTGYGDGGGFVNREETPELAAVTCEACHGPSADHAGSAFPEVVATANGRDCSTCEMSKICRLCHTGRHSPEFVLSEALEAVSCETDRDIPGGLAGGKEE